MEMFVDIVKQNKILKKNMFFQNQKVILDKK